MYFDPFLIAIVLIIYFSTGIRYRYRSKRNVYLDSDRVLIQRCFLYDYFSYRR
jgi:hypothetical protein